MSAAFTRRDLLAGGGILAAGGVPPRADPCRQGTGDLVIVRSAVDELVRGLPRGCTAAPGRTRHVAPTGRYRDRHLRLEDAERCAGFRLLDPSRPLPAPVAWRQRHQRGAQALAWLTRG